MALKGNFVIEVAPEDGKGAIINTKTFEYAIITTFRGDRYCVNLDIFLCNDIQDELCAGVFQTVTFSPDWYSSDNILKQGYNYLKKLPMFINSEDIVKENVAI